MKNVVGPAAARLRDTPALMPCTAAVITVTTSTPTAMPRMVRPARTLFVRIASNAMTTPSTSWYSEFPSVRIMSVSSFAAHGQDWIETRRTARWIRPGNDADPGANADGEYDRPGSDRRGQRRHLSDDLGEREAEANADQRPDGAERRRFDEELRENVPASRT